MDNYSGSGKGITSEERSVGFEQEGEIFTTGVNNSHFGLRNVLTLVA